MSNTGGTNQCPTCGKGGFKNERGLKTHRGRMHDFEGNYGMFECDHCGEEFKRHKGTVKDNPRPKYCSYRCARTARNNE